MADAESQPEPPLVVIGSSAGGIDALGAMLGSVPEGLAAPIVIAQHLQPDRESRLAEILRSRSRIPVQEVDTSEKLVPGTAYVIPADRHVVITDHEVSLQPSGRQRPAPSIDRLLVSASETFGERLIAVILSGMGSDGAIGAAQVKTGGGTVIIQNPSTATHPAMPRALPPTIVDFVADADRIGELLGELVGGGIRAASPDDDRLLATFLDQIRDRTGMDFSAYKLPTVHRRLQRRMVATGSPRLREYIRHVQKHPEEYGRLTSSFLIKVTQFFRDTDLFEHLRESVLPELVEHARENGRELRIWSGGCATGEEAYSLAILITEALREELDSFSVRIFATDVDDEAIMFARRGVYGASSIASVPPDILARYFTRAGADYEVHRAVRSLVVFGQHDLGQRAPFPRIDLALCRNVLIYFTPELQRRALQLFAFALRDGGVLVLGKSESTTPLAELFVLDQPRLKIYRRSGPRVLLPETRMRDRVSLVPARPARRERWAGPTSIVPQTLPRAASHEAGDSLLLGLPVGVVLVDKDYDILTLNGSARRLLGIHGTAVGHDVVHLAHTLPSEPLRHGLDAALRGEITSVTLAVEDAANEGERSVVKLIFHPHRRGDDGQVGGAVITVIDATADVRAQEDAALAAGRLSEDMERTRERVVRLERSNRELLTANEELTSANALLETANEDLLLSNEEVQATTEEVETLNEELQATNEELETLNEELQATVEELNTTNDDLEARSVELRDAAATLHEKRSQSEIERQRLSLVLDGMSEAVLAVRADGSPSTSNHAYDELFGGDLDDWHAQDDAGEAIPRDDWPDRRAARGEPFAMAYTVSGPDGTRRWLEAVSRGAPSGEGGVVVFRDITDRSMLRLQERFMAAASHELRTPLAALLAFLQLAQRRLAEDQAGEASGYLERSVAEARRLGDLIGRLFDVALMQHGRLSLQHEPIDLVRVVKSALETAAILEPAVDFRIRRAPRALRTQADPVRLQQILLNVLTNAAVHGSGDGGMVTITVGRRGGEAHIEITDTGDGIPDSISRTSFVPFVTADDARSQGLGLGLFIAHELLSAHGGRLEISGQDGSGTKVTLVLPIRGGRRTTTRTGT